ncbi:hypothetical protein PS2_027871 [Malus domestica]
MDCKGGEGEGRGMAGRSEAAKNGVGEKSSIALSIASVLSHGQDPFTEIEAEAAKVECFNRLYISPSLLVPTAAQQGQVSQQESFPDHELASTQKSICRTVGSGK